MTYHITTTVQLPGCGTPLITTRTVPADRVARTVAAARRRRGFVAVKVEARP